MRLGVSSEVSVEAQFAGRPRLTPSRNLRAKGRLWQILSSAQVRTEHGIELFQHLGTALSRSYRECLRRSLGYFFFLPTTAPFFSTLRRPAWRFWQFFSRGEFLLLLAFWPFLPFCLWNCCLFGLPPPPAACSARPAGVALSISSYPAPHWRPKHNGGIVFFYIAPARLVLLKFRLLVLLSRAGADPLGIPRSPFADSGFSLNFL